MALKMYPEMTNYDFKSFLNSKKRRSNWQCNYFIFFINKKTIKVFCSLKIFPASLSIEIIYERGSEEKSISFSQLYIRQGLYAKGRLAGLDGVFILLVIQPR